MNISFTSNWNSFNRFENLESLPFRIFIHCCWPAYGIQIINKYHPNRITSLMRYRCKIQILRTINCEQNVKTCYSLIHATICYGNGFDFCFVSFCLVFFFFRCLPLLLWFLVHFSFSRLPVQCPIKQKKKSSPVKWFALNVQFSMSCEPTFLYLRRS